MSNMIDETCQATTASGEPCQNEACDDGYCWMDDHAPDPDDEPEAEAEAESEAEVESEPEPEPESEDDGSDHVTEGERFENVRVRAPEGGHIAGYSFSPNEIKVIPATASVKQALRRGKLQNVA